MAASCRIESSWFSFCEAILNYSYRARFNVSLDLGYSRVRADLSTLCCENWIISVFRAGLAQQKNQYRLCCDFAVRWSRYYTLECWWHNQSLTQSWSMSRSAGCFLARIDFAGCSFHWKTSCGHNFSICFVCHRVTATLNFHFQMR